MNMSINNNGIGIGMPMPETGSAGEVRQDQSWRPPAGRHERRHSGKGSMTTAGRHALPPQLPMPNHQQYLPQQQPQVMQLMQQQPPPMLFMQQQPPQQFQFTQFDPTQSQQAPQQQATQSPPSKYEGRPLPSALLPAQTTSTPPSSSTSSPADSPSKTINLADIGKGFKWLGKAAVNGAANALLNKIDETKENWSTSHRPTHIKVGSTGGSDD